MNFTLYDLDPDFFAKIKAKATAEGVTVKALILKLLTTWLGVFVLAASLSACGGGGSPASPTPPPPTQTFTTSGTVSALNGGQPLSGIVVTASTVSSTTDGAGQFSMLTNSTQTLPVTVSGPSIVTRRTSLASHTGIALSVFNLAAGFDLDFYRQLARGSLGQGGPYALQTWTAAPSFYIRTVDEAGRAVDATNLNQAETVIRDTIGPWTGGRFTAPTIVRGAERGPAASVTLQWNSTTPGTETFCGYTDFIGVSATVLDLNLNKSGCQCNGGIGVDASVIRHELGHALGFAHTSNPADVMSVPRTICDQGLSAREREYAGYAYQRASGNQDPDTDPTTIVPLKVRSLGQ